MEHSFFDASMYIKTNKGVQEDLEVSYDSITAEIEIVGRKKSELFYGRNVNVDDIIIYITDEETGITYEGAADGDYDNGFTLEDEAFRKNILELFHRRDTKFQKKEIEKELHSIKNDENLIKAKQLQEKYQDFRNIQCEISAVYSDGSIDKFPGTVNAFKGTICSENNADLSILLKRQEGNKIHHSQSYFATLSIEGEEYQIDFRKEGNIIDSSQEQLIFKFQEISERLTNKIPQEDEVQEKSHQFKI